jgi:hypothetical protein
VVAESKSAAPCSGISLQHAVFIAGPGPLLTKRSVRCQMPMPECTSLNEDCVDRDGNTFLQQYGLELRYLFYCILLSYSVLWLNIG